jgi:glycosyltransferase involved in cell wall biosynthesis
VSKSHKIIFVSWLISNGGIENHLYNLSILIKKNHPESDLFLISRYCNPNVKIFFEKNKIPIKILYIKPYKSTNTSIFNTIILFFKILFTVGFRNADIIYSMELSPLSLVYKKIFLKHNSSFIYNIVGDPKATEKHSNTTLYKYLFLNIVDTVLFESEIHKNNFKFDLRNKSSYILPHLANICEKIPPCKSKSKIFRIGFLGRADKHKGAERLLKFFIINSKPEWSLTYYSIEGDFLNELIETLNENRSKYRNIKISNGWQSTSELRDIFHNIDLTVLWSDSEGIPLILIESLANGTPFIASDVGAIKILSRNNPYCQLFENNDNPEIIFSNFIAFLSKEKNLSEKVFYKFLELYNLKEIQNNYLNILINSRIDN